jgi:hypothetical protein
MHCGRDDVQEKCDGAEEQGRLEERNRGGIISVKCYRIDAGYVQRAVSNGWQRALVEVLKLTMQLISKNDPG